MQGTAFARGCSSSQHDMLPMPVILRTQRPLLSWVSHRAVTSCGHKGATQNPGLPQKQPWAARVTSWSSCTAATGASYQTQQPGQCHLHQSGPLWPSQSPDVWKTNVRNNSPSSC